MNRLLPEAYGRVSLALIMLVLTACTSGAGLKPFVTDGCSNFPEGTREHKNLWLRCCVEHDKAYWQGGTRAQRLAADLALRECVREVEKPLTAQIMLAGVRVGGSPFWPTKYRWGYGWPYPRWYRLLTPDEQAEVAEKLEQYDQNQVGSEQ